VQLIMVAIKYLLHMHILKRINDLVKRNPLLVPLLSHLSAVHHIMPPYFFQMCCNIYPVIGLLSCLFLSGFPITNLYDIVTFHVLLFMCSPHLILLHLIILLFCEELTFYNRKHRKYSNSSETEMKTNCLLDDIIKQQNFILWLVHT
jgi:hypothetical protein